MRLAHHSRAGSSVVASPLTAPEARRLDVKVVVENRAPGFELVVLTVENWRRRRPGFELRSLAVCPLLTE
jgi:hypothetical protein